MHEYVGTCACGQLVVRLLSERTADRFRPRSDAPTCGFCREHDGTWISDPAGLLRLPATEGTTVRRFASAEVAFHFCSACGTLVFATFEDVAVVRVALFASIRDAAAPTATTCFDGETVAAARQRRLDTWTPVERR